jgi:zinc transport system substrate-binding protein
LCVAAGLVAAGCGGDDRGAPHRVVAAFYPLAFAAEQVGAPSVETLTPPGAEPHDFELSPRDVERMRDASLVVYLGGGFQPAVDAALRDRSGPSLDVLQGLGLLPGGGEGLAVDPHVWLDPIRYASIGRAIARARGGVGAADRFVARLDELDADFRRGLDRCRRREIVTSHAAFGYLAARYGLRQLPLVGLAPEAEPSPKDVAALARQVRATGATTIFFETLVSPKLAETVAREAGAATAVLDPVEGLTDADVHAGLDYFSVMRRNLAALRKALACA